MKAKKVDKSTELQIRLEQIREAIERAEDDLKQEAETLAVVEEPQDDMNCEYCE